MEESTFAQEATRIQKKYDKAIKANNSFAKKAFSREMDRLVQEQEDYRAKNIIDETTNKFSAGGDLNKRLATERTKRGRDLNNSEIRQILGKDYNTWATWVGPKLSSTRGTNEKESTLESVLFGDRMSSISDTEPVSNSKQGSIAPYTPTDREYEINPDFNPYRTNPIPTLAGGLIGGLSYGTKTKADPIALDRLGANYVDYDPARRDIRRQLDETKIDALNSIRAAGGSRAQQLNAMRNTASIIADKEARALADSHMQEYTTNASIRTANQVANQGIATNEKEANYQDRRYVDETNRSIDIGRAEQGIGTLKQLNQDRLNDMYMATRDSFYGIDNKGRLTNKMRLKNQNKPIVASETNTVPDDNIGVQGNEINLPTNSIWDIEQKYKSGGMLKYKCGGRLKKK